MKGETGELRRHITEILKRWNDEGLPGRQSLRQEASDLRSWRTERSIDSLWSIPPLMITATLDDGFGFGLEVIELFASAVGLRVHALGLRQSPETIIAACGEHRPHLLGLTVLQFDSEEDLLEISSALPPETRLIVGGAIFSADPDLARRAGVHFVARDAGAFLSYLLQIAA